MRPGTLTDDPPLTPFIGETSADQGTDWDVIAASARCAMPARKFLLPLSRRWPARSAAEEEALTRRLNLQDCVRFFGYIPEEQTAGFYAKQYRTSLFPTDHTEVFDGEFFNAAAAAPADYHHAASAPPPTICRAEN